MEVGKRTGNWCSMQVCLLHASLWDERSKMKVLSMIREWSSWPSDIKWSFIRHLHRLSFRDNGPIQS